MKQSHQAQLEQYMAELRRQNPQETHFHQAVEEVVESVLPWYLQHDEYRKARILERVTEPDRIVSFRVTWETDNRDVVVNRGWRVQFNHTLDLIRVVCDFIPPLIRAC